MKYNITRDDDAVSAAVATVLLFGGVVSIIGLMLISMMPIIEELEGSIERNDMSSQMMILAQQTEVLSEHGMPGDSTEVELIPLDGSLSWDSTRGGMWYSATWQDDSSFRMKSILDFDDQIEVKHPESKTTAICYDDLRLGPTRPFFYSIPNWVESLSVSAHQGLASPLGPINIKIQSDNSLVDIIEMNVDESANVDSTLYTDLRLESSHELVILASSGLGGASFITPDNPSRIDNTGRSWSVPLPSGDSIIQVMSKDANLITTLIDGTETTAVVNTDVNSRIGSYWQSSVTLSEPTIILSLIHI